jgi:hypothetical protein
VSALTDHNQRKVYCVLSARSLGYSAACLKSLARNALETLDVVLITDGPEDKARLQAIDGLDPEGRHSWRVIEKAEVDAIAAEKLAAFPAVRQFREGHPCWRKVTDPPLVAGPGEEIIILDPDVYFPNGFAFEPAPAAGIYLMYQATNCLLPEDAVRDAYEKGLKMADHTDIGVAQLGPTPFDWAHLERLCATMDFARWSWSMHVESIVWAELAMTMGGGHLDPKAWHCFANTITGRLQRKLGRSGVETLAHLDIGGMKCLHGGGEAKNWFVAAEDAGIFTSHARHDKPTPIRPFADYPRDKFERKFRLRHFARRLGLYKLIGG